MSLLVPMKRNNTITWPNLGELETQLDRIFNAPNESAARSTGRWMPAVDIHETDEAYILEADLPGLSRKDIDVKVVEDRVTISGQRKLETENEKKGYRRTERVEGNFERSFRLQGGIDGANVEARFENGVLSVKLPKPEETKPRQIEVMVK
jgi:HSP20 family protein